MMPKAPRSADAFSLGVLLLALAPGVCAGQTMNSNASAYNAGYGRVAGSENQPVNVSTTDSSGNLVVAGGLVRSNTAGSVFAGGVGSGASGVASGLGASAIGNSLSVVVQGNDNVVVVNSTQTNTGAVTATTSGK